MGEGKGVDVDAATQFNTCRLVGCLPCSCSWWMLDRRSLAASTDDKSMSRLLIEELPPLVIYLPSVVAPLIPLDGQMDGGYAAQGLLLSSISKADHFHHHHQ